MRLFKGTPASVLRAVAKCTHARVCFADISRVNGGNLELSKGTWGAVLSTKKALMSERGLCYGNISEAQDHALSWEVFEAVFPGETIVATACLDKQKLIGPASEIGRPFTCRLVWAGPHICAAPRPKQVPWHYLGLDKNGDELPPKVLTGQEVDLALDLALQSVKVLTRNGVLDYV